MEINLEIRGVSNILGVNIPNIFGGFGKGKKSVLTKTIAEIHSYSGVGKVNVLIDSHRDEFEDGIDIIDLKDEKYKNFLMLLRDNEILSQNSINKSEHIYLLSEQGYMLLVGFMEGEKAKEIRKQLRRDYFKMKEMQVNRERLLADTFYKSIFADSEEERTINTRIFGELKEEYGREKQREEDEKFLIEERKESYLSTINMLKEVDKNIFSKGFFQSLENKGYGQYILVRKKVRFISNDKFENDFVKNGLCRRSVNYVYTWNPLMIDYILNNENDNGLYESSLKLTKIMLNENYETTKKKKTEQENKGTTIKQTYKTINKLCKLEFTEKTFIKFLININWINSNRSVTTYAKEKGYAYKYRDYTKITKEGLEKLINMFDKGEL